MSPLKLPHNKAARRLRLAARCLRRRCKQRIGRSHKYAMRLAQPTSGSAAKRASGQGTSPETAPAPGGQGRHKEPRSASWTVAHQLADDCRASPHGGHRFAGERDGPGGNSGSKSKVVSVPLVPRWDEQINAVVLPDGRCCPWLEGVKNTNRIRF